MEKIIFRVIVLMSACCLSKKHVFVKDQKNWGEARKFCQDRYTDISPLNNKQVEKQFTKSFEDMEGWIGIYWDQGTQKWKWSGGHNVTYHNNLDLPDNTDPTQLKHTADNVYWTKDEWQWKNGGESHSFFCLNLTLVQEEKTWEEALKHCRKNDGDLASLLSVNENLLATNKIKQTGITEPVWIGLRYLGDSWLWVNWGLLDYDSLPQERFQVDQCPTKRHCGALTKGGAWENRDCQEKLSFICG